MQMWVYINSKVDSGKPKPASLNYDFQSVAIRSFPKPLLLAIVGLLARYLFEQRKQI